MIGDLEASLKLSVYNLVVKSAAYIKEHNIRKYKYRPLPIEAYCLVIGVHNVCFTYNYM